MTARPRQAAPASPFEPARLGPLTLRNRFIKAATFEGSSPKGQVTDALIDFHRRVGAGGAAMTTVAYLAVSPEGRTDRHCVVVGDEVLTDLRRLTDAVHATGALVAAQLGHAGPVANARSNRAPSLAPSRYISPMGTMSRAITEAEIARVTTAYGDAARSVVEAGFDSIEVHLGHNYLLSAFLSPKLNRRRDQWGGSVENRARFARQVVRGVRDAVGGARRGHGQAQHGRRGPGRAVARGQRGGGPAPRGRRGPRRPHPDRGSSLANPMYLFRGEAPRQEFAATLPKALQLGFRVMGRRFMPDYPFEEAFFLPYARQFRAALDMPLVLLGGINELDTVHQALAEGFSFVAMARALLRQPDLVARMEAGTSSASLCIHCNKCMPTIYSGTRCVLVDSPATPHG